MRIINFKSSFSEGLRVLNCSLKQVRLFKEKLRGKSREIEDNKNAALKNVKEAHSSKKTKNQGNETANTDVILHANKEIL